MGLIYLPNTTIMPRNASTSQLSGLTLATNWSQTSQIGMIAMG
ncbi:MAG TPA: hypothetical protein VGF38_11620 [Ktedonobacterales bacterium]|jgi:hypothetical protein